MADAPSASTRTPAQAPAGQPGDVLAQPHRRYNPLTDEWVLVSTKRIQRPLQGRRDARRPAHRVAYDPGCYLCPGNVRANGEANPAYRATFVFTNDFAALRPESSDARLETGLLRAEGERGTCRVICFSPRHDLTMARMAPAAVRAIVDLWADQTTELGATFRWVQVFENRGETMGATNPHPHGQIWAGTALPVQARSRGRHPAPPPRGDRAPAAARLRRSRSTTVRGSSSRTTTGWSSSRSGPPGRSRRSSSPRGRRGGWRTSIRRRETRSARP